MRYCYQLSSNQYACTCILTSECERIAALIGSDKAEPIMRSNRLVPAAELASAETRVEAWDTLAVRKSIAQNCYWPKHGHVAECPACGMEPARIVHLRSLVLENGESI